MQIHGPKPPAFICQGRIRRSTSRGGGRRARVNFSWSSKEGGTLLDLIVETQAETWALGSGWGARLFSRFNQSQIPGQCWLPLCPFVACGIMWRLNQRSTGGKTYSELLANSVNSFHGFNYVVSAISSILLLSKCYFLPQSVGHSLSHLCDTLIMVSSYTKIHIFLLILEIFLLICY